MEESLLNQIYTILEDSDTGVSIDSRTMKKNDVFIAIKGESFNGNLFAKQAIEAGASLVIIDEPLDFEHPKMKKVDDSLVFLQTLASEYRKTFDIPVIGIAGSNGKTTTKELLHAAVSNSKKIYSTPGNFNNHIGVPLTILKWKKDIEAAIVELGTNAPGEIEFLCKIAQPNLGIITNIGKEHLAGFGTLEAVAAEESMLYYYLLKHQGTAFVNQQDELLSRMANRLDQKVYYNETSDKSSSLVLTPYVTFVVKSNEVLSHVSGQHNYENILAALAIASHIGVDLEAAVSGINGYVPTMNRNEILVEGSTIIIKDAYNANPSSMEKAIELLVDFDASKNKIAILGDMFEMGEHSAKEHQAIVDFALAKKVTLILIGEDFSNTNFDGNRFKSVDEASDFLNDLPCHNSVILLKGSRGMKMENVIDHLSL